MVGLTALNVFVTPVTALGLALRVEGSGWGPHWLGVADGALAAGAILGSLVGIRWQPTHAARTAFWTLVVQGLGLAAVGLPTRARRRARHGRRRAHRGAGVGVAVGVVPQGGRPGYIGRVSSVTSLGDMTLMPLSIPLLGARGRRGRRAPGHRRLRRRDVAALPVVRDAGGRSPS